MELNAFYSKSKKKDDENNLLNKILFLHGMGGTGQIWKPIVITLEDNYSCLCPDQRGHGQSIVSKSQISSHHYSPIHFGQDIVDTLPAYNFHPCWVVGHSMGVRSACAFAHLKPEWVRGLILVDLGFEGLAGGGFGENLSNFLKKLPPSFSSRADARAFMDQNSPDSSITQYLMAVGKIQNGTFYFPFDHNALIQTLSEARSFSIRPWVSEAAQKNIPVLILRGEKTSVWTHQEFLNEKELFKDFPKITFIEIQSAGHGLPFEKKKVFLELLNQFITDNS